jgi:hypothetical protein
LYDHAILTNFLLESILLNLGYTWVILVISKYNVHRTVKISLDIHINKPILFEVKFIGDKGEFDKGVLLTTTKIMKKENFSSSKDVRGAPTTWLLSSPVGLGKVPIPPVMYRLPPKAPTRMYAILLFIFIPKGMNRRFKLPS